MSVNRQKQRRLVWIAAIGIVPIALLIVFLLSGSESTGVYQSGLPAGAEALALGENSGAYQTDALNLLGTGEQGRILEAVREGRIDLQLELRRLRAACPEPADSAKCDAHVAAQLAKIPEPDGSQLLSLFRTFQEYEKRLLAMPKDRTMTPAERYALLRKVRREMFGSDDARLVFGIEEANYDYQQLIRQALSGQLHGSAAEKMRAFEEQRRSIFGDYYATLLKREGANRRYAVELIIRQSDLQKMDQAERESALQSIRVSYFGKEGAARMARQAARGSKQNQAAQARLDEFLAAEEKLLRENPNLAGEEKRRRIEELRQQYLGASGPSEPGSGPPAQ